MPRPRFIARGVVAILALVCWATGPATAAAAVPLPDAAAAAIGTVESAVVTVPAPVQETAEKVAKAVEPAVGAVKPPVAAAQQIPAPVVEPVAEAVAVGAAAQSSAKSPPPKQARAGVVRAAASSPVERLSAGRGNRRGDDSGGAAELTVVEPRPDLQVAAHKATTAVDSDGAPAPAEPAPQPETAFGFAAGVVASGASTSFLFGGGLALLVAALLLAGPGLLRRLAPLSAVCRPTAFVVVLERPG